MISVTLSFIDVLCTVHLVKGPSSHFYLAFIDVGRAIRTSKTKAAGASISAPFVDASAIVHAGLRLKTFISVLGTRGSFPSGRATAFCGDSDVDTLTPVDAPVFDLTRGAALFAVGSFIQGRAFTFVAGRDVVAATAVLARAVMTEVSCLAIIRRVTPTCPKRGGIGFTWWMLLGISEFRNSK